MNNTKTPEQIEHILAVAQWIEDHPEEFNMDLWGWRATRGERSTYSSGWESALCIGGTSDMLNQYHGAEQFASERIAARFGIPSSHAERLCFGLGADTLTTPEKGVACLRDIAAGRDAIEAIEAQA